MAVKNPTVVNVTMPSDTVAKTFAYAGMANGDTGAPITGGLDHDDMSVQVTGTFGAGGNLRIEGSNDGGANWAALSSDGAAGALNLTAAGIKRIAERCDQYRPNVTAGDGTTALTVTFVGRRKGPAR